MHALVVVVDRERVARLPGEEGVAAVLPGADVDREAEVGHADRARERIDEIHRALQDGRGVAGERTRADAERVIERAERLAERVMHPERACVAPAPRRRRRAELVAQAPYGVAERTSNRTRPPLFEPARGLLAHQSREVRHA